MKMLKMGLSVALMAVLPMAQAEVKIAPSVTFNSASQIPSDESLQKLVEVMQYDKNLSKVLPQYQEKAIQWINQSLQNNPLMNQLTIEEKIQFEQEKEILLQTMINQQYTPEIRRQIINQYKEISKTLYTQEEVNALIDFFSTKLGQSLRSKQGDFALLTLQKIDPIARENQKKLATMTLTKLQEKLEQISKTPILKVKP